MWADADRVGDDDAHGTRRKRGIRRARAMPGAAAPRPACQATGGGPPPCQPHRVTARVAQRPRADRGRADSSAANDEFQLERAQPAWQCVERADPRGHAARNPARSRSARPAAAPAAAAASGERRATPWPAPARTAEDATPRSSRARRAARPSTTGNVRRPTLRSCAMSRWLLTTSAAAASAPIATAGERTCRAERGARSACSRRRRRRRRPKNTNTTSSPSGV